MPGRRQTSEGKRPRLRWLISAAGLAIAGSVLLAFAPNSAGSTTTVNAQLSLTGVATKTSITGGSEIGVHPGDSVDFKASAVPTVGLDNIPSLGPVLDSVLHTLLGQYQVVVTFPASFPGGAQTVTLGGPTSGACKGAPDKLVTFPDKGTFTFTFKVQYVLPLILGCQKSGLSDTNLNLLAKAGVKLNATNSWVGAIVVADNPPTGGIGIQLPGVSVAPSIAGHQLPTIGVPGVQITIPVTAPRLPGLPGGSSGGGSTSAGGGSSSGGGTQIPVPAEVVPSGDGAAVYGNVGGYAPLNLPNVAALGGGTAAQPAAVGGNAKPAAPIVQNSTGKHRNIELAASRPSSGQLSIILAIIAVVALALVAGTYARLYLLRHDI